MTPSTPTQPNQPAASRRATWPIRVCRLGEEPGDDLSASTTPEERIEMVWELTRRMWSLTGRAWPEYARADLPVRVIRPA